MILAGDVGGTKCNLALFSEKSGKLTTVFKQRFASKEFAKFELIVKEFSRQAASHLSSDRVVAAASLVMEIEDVFEARMASVAMKRLPFRTRNRSY